jgi:DNA repair protein RadC
MYKLKDLPRSEKPRERLFDIGASALSDSELLAIVLSSGGKNKSVLLLARELLSLFGSLKDLCEANFNELTQVKNIGVAKASIVKAVYELGLRISEAKEAVSDPLTSPEQVFRYTKRKFADKKQEAVVVVTLDSRGRATSSEVLFLGNLSVSIIEPRLIFIHALKRNASSIILVHNHPSGDPAPSEEDVEATWKLAEAGKLIGVQVIDHVIVTDSSFLSLKAVSLLEGGDKK